MKLSGLQAEYISAMTTALLLYRVIKPRMVVLVIRCHPVSHTLGHKPAHYALHVEKKSVPSLSIIAADTVECNKTRVILKRQEAGDVAIDIREYVGRLSFPTCSRLRAVTTLTTLKLLLHSLAVPLADGTVDAIDQAVSADPRSSPDCHSFQLQNDTCTWLDDPVARRYRDDMYLPD